MSMRSSLVVALALAGAPAVAAAQPAAPPAALTAAAKAQVGTYRCKGHHLDGDDRRPVASKLKVTADLDGQWLVWRLTQTRTSVPKRKPLQFLIHRRVAADGTWHAVQVDSTGGRAELTAPDGANWSGTLVAGTVKVAIRDHQEINGKTIRLWGEYEVEPGMFEPGYDVTCKR
jgi:hypothetical protein